MPQTIGFFRTLLICALLHLAGLPAAVAADAGERPPVSLEDQFGHTQRIDWHHPVLFSHDRAGGKVISGMMANHPGDFLARSHIIYVADISGMPAPITRLFALPKMRKYSYPVALDRTGRVSALLPRRKGAVTVLSPHQAPVFVTDANALVQVLLDLTARTPAASAPVEGAPQRPETAPSLQ